MSGLRSSTIQGQLKMHAQGPWDEVMRLGYSPVSARIHLRLTADLARWLEARRVPLREFSDARGRVPA